MENADVSISLEFTPNPNTLKFVVDRPLLERGAANFVDVSKAGLSPLAGTLFGVPGVAAVMIGTNFVTITRAPQGDWDVLAEKVPLLLEEYLKSGKPIMDPSWKAEVSAPATGGDSSVETRIKEVLDNEIRPAVAMDGGDITFGRYEDGIVYLHLQGSCSQCPSSVATLKMGVETRLKEVVPEIKEVVQV
jgi:Fe-S cluster biogenesis protein NfuA